MPFHNFQHPLPFFILPYIFLVFSNESRSTLDATDTTAVIKTYATVVSTLNATQCTAIQTTYDASIFAA